MKKTAKGRMRAKLDHMRNDLSEQGKVLLKAYQTAKIPLAKEDYATALTKLLECHEIIAKILAMPMLEKINQETVDFIYSAIVICVTELKRPNVLMNLLPIACKLGATKPFEIVAIDYYHKGEIQISFEILITIYNHNTTWKDRNSSNLLGVLLYSGHGKYKDKPRYTLAEAFYKFAIKQDIPEALNNLGKLYSQCPSPFFRDYAKAIECYTQAFQKFNDLKALYYLALLHTQGDGQGRHKDPVKALDLFTQAAMLGSVNSMIGAAMLLMHPPEGITYDPVKAEKYLRQAITAKNPAAFNFLSLYIFEERIPSANKTQEALDLCLQGAKLGSTNCMYNYAVIKSSFSDQYDTDVVNWYSKAAAQGMPEAQYDLIYYYIKYMNKNNNMSQTLKDSDHQKNNWLSRKSCKFIRPCFLNACKKAIIKNQCHRSIYRVYNTCVF